jgi:hypothetical protein
MSTVQLRGSIDLSTRKGTKIENAFDRRDATDGERQQVLALRRQYLAARARPVGPSHIYNCHGLTFASRRTNIWNPAQVQVIIDEDDYREVPAADVMPGDIVIYFNAQLGDIEHSGVVVERHPPLTLLVLSKWGMAHEAIHALGDCPYNATGSKFFRILK